MYLFHVTVLHFYLTICDQNCKHWLEYQTVHVALMFVFECTWGDNWKYRTQTIMKTAYDIRWNP